MQATGECDVILTTPVCSRIHCGFLPDSYVLLLCHTGEYDHSAFLAAAAAAIPISAAATGAATISISTTAAASAATTAATTLSAAPTGPYSSDRCCRIRQQ